jgi:hypothetical protein
MMGGSSINSRGRNFDKIAKNFSRSRQLNYKRG